ncbi:hypothetical protein Aau02nite_88750 [Amorphoplanes auranticolor]|uniref:DUF2834 domain-containing protein n=1 Tax=Actinoplanes auranticolor TaxID=47988 RepID=A0A919SZH7_9ACTN|nr:hypothetical protein Aau02nite_88750 [Actinoplanes auranticolor]
MASRRVYLGLAVLGAVVPYAALAVFISRHGLSLSELAQQAFGSPGATFFALDVVVGGVTVLVAATRDSRLIGRKWAVVAATLLVGPGCGLPLWLALRQTGP